MTDWMNEKASGSLPLLRNEGDMHTTGWRRIGEQPRPSYHYWLNPGDKPLKANLASSVFPQIPCYCPRLHTETQWPISCCVAGRAGITEDEFNCVVAFLWLSSTCSYYCTSWLPAQLSTLHRSAMSLTCLGDGWTFISHLFWGQALWLDVHNVCYYFYATFL